jgi:hypothetical protein
MTYRHSRANALARPAIIVTIGLALLGCNATASPAVTAAPTTAVTASPGAPASSGSVQVDPYAQALISALATKPLIVHVEQTAKATQITPTTSGSTSADLVVALSGDFSGDDVSFRLMTTAAGQTTEQDIIVVGDSAYGRDAGGVWKKAPRTAIGETVDNAIKTIRLTSDPAELTHVGIETIEGRQLHHLSGQGKVLSNPASGGVGRYDAFDIWVEEDGTPVIARTTFSASDATGSQVTGTTEFHYSKFGGPIEIAAPSIAPPSIAP